MHELIDKDEAIKILCDGCTADCDVPYTACITVQKIIDMPTIEPEVRNGRWITKDSKTAKCSCCGWWQRTKTYYLPDDIPAFSKCYRFCTSCGVQMDGGADNGNR